MGAAWLFYNDVARVPDPLSSGEYLAGEQTSWELPQEQQQQQPQQHQQTQQTTPEEDGNVGCAGRRYLRSSGCSTSRCLRRPSSRRPGQQETSLHESCSERQGQREGEREREGQGEGERDQQAPWTEPRCRRRIFGKTSLKAGFNSRSSFKLLSGQPA